MVNMPKPIMLIIRFFIIFVGDHTDVAPQPRCKCARCKQFNIFAFQGCKTEIIQCIVVRHMLPAISSTTTFSAEWGSSVPCASVSFLGANKTKHNLNNGVTGLIMAW